MGKISIFKILLKLYKKNNLITNFFGENFSWIATTLSIKEKDNLFELLSDMILKTSFSSFSAYRSINDHCCAFNRSPHLYCKSIHMLHSGLLSPWQLHRSTESWVFLGGLFLLNFSMRVPFSLFDHPLSKNFLVYKNNLKMYRYMWNENISSLLKWVECYSRFKIMPCICISYTRFKKNYLLQNKDKDLTQYIPKLVSFLLVLITYCFSIQICTS